MTHMNESNRLQQPVSIPTNGSILQLALKEPNKAAGIAQAVRDLEAARIILQRALPYQTNDFEQFVSGRERLLVAAMAANEVDLVDAVMREESLDASKVSQYRKKGYRHLVSISMGEAADALNIAIQGYRKTWRKTEAGYIAHDGDNPNKKLENVSRFSRGSKAWIDHHFLNGELIGESPSRAYGWAMDVLKGRDAIDDGHQPDASLLPAPEPRVSLSVCGNDFIFLGAPGAGGCSVSPAWHSLGPVPEDDVVDFALRECVVANVLALYSSGALYRDGAFDPQVVEAIETSIDAMQEIHDRFAEEPPQPRERGSR